MFFSSINTAFTEMIQVFSGSLSFALFMQAHRVLYNVSLVCHEHQRGGKTTKDSKGYSADVRKQCQQQEKIAGEAAPGAGHVLGGM